MLRVLIFGLAFIGNFAPALSDNFSPWFGGDSQLPFQVPVAKPAIETAAQISDITNSIDAIAASTNSTTCPPDGCPEGGNTAKTIVTTVKASQF